MINSPRDFFLDTSIQIEKDTIPRNEQARLSETLKGCNRVCTSTFVKMEYRLSLVRDMVYLYNQLVDAICLADVIFRIAGLPAQNQRRVRRMLNSIAGFMGEPENAEIKNKDLVEQAILFFRPIIKNWSMLFDRSVRNDVLDETGCYLAKGTPILRGTKFETGISNCKTSETRCKIVEFFKDNIEGFKTILQILSEAPSLDEEQLKLKAVLEKAIGYPQNMSDSKNCRKCGDAIIATECPEDYTVFTMNKMHFVPICQALHKNFEVYE